MPHAFVTGATGFLGLNLVEQLAAQGWRTTALHRPGADLALLKRFDPALAPGDILDPNALGRAVPEGVDAVFHCAADTSVWSRNNARQTRVNVDGTANVLAAARARGARRFVHVSTWNTFGLDRATMDETTPQTGAASWINYTRTKSLAEAAVKRANADGLPAVVVNPSHILGRYDRDGWGTLIVMVHKGTLPGVPPGAGSFCHAEAVAKALIAAALRGRPGENYLLGGADATFLEVVRVIGELTGRPVPRRPLPALVLRAAARVKAGLARISGREPDLTPEAAAMVLVHPRIVSTKAADELGYRPTALRPMIEDAWRWMRDAGRLD